LAKDPHQQPAGTHHEGNPSQDQSGRRFLGWAIVPQSRCGQFETYRRQQVVNTKVHEYDAALRGENINQWSRRMMKCAKDSSH
jgi:hypothetical protein